MDAKTRKDLLKYILTKKKGEGAKEEEVCVPLSTSDLLTLHLQIEAEVGKLEEEGRGTAALTDEISDNMKVCIHP